MQDAAEIITLEHKLEGHNNLAEWLHIFCTYLGRVLAMWKRRESKVL